MRQRRLWCSMFVGMALVAAGCGGSDDDADDATIEIGDADQSAESDAESDDDSADDTEDGDDDTGSDPADENSGDGGDGADASGGDFMTVFGLPPGSAAETDYAPYEFREDEFGTSESVTFEVTGASVDEIIAFYQETVPAMGYVVDDPIMLGESVAINISDPDNPGTTAVIQAGQTGDVVTVNQNINRLNPAEDAPTTTVGASTSTDAEAAAGASALTVDGSNVMIVWDQLLAVPFYAAANQASDPFFHIHTIPESDGFFFSLEMYLEWGQAWAGETGTFEISCSDPASSTGICPYFDPDGPGPMDVLGGDFMTTGVITINSLGDDGYDLEVGPVVFSDGTVIDPFTMTG